MTGRLVLTDNESTGYTVTAWRQDRFMVTESDHEQLYGTVSERKRQPSDHWEWNDRPTNGVLTLTVTRKDRFSSLTETESMSLQYSNWQDRLKVKGQVYGIGQVNDRGQAAHICRWVVKGQVYWRATVIFHKGQVYDHRILKQYLRDKRTGQAYDKIN